MSFLDWLLGKRIEQARNPAVFRKCTYCYWSSYKGKICSRTNPPTNIIEVGQAQMCDSYTVTPPDWVTPAVEALQVSTAVKLDTLKNSADATKAAVEAVASKTDLVKAAVEGLPKKILYQKEDAILMAQDNTQTNTTLGASQTVKTLTLYNVPQSKALKTVLFSAWQSGSGGYPDYVRFYVSAPDLGLVDIEECYTTIYPDMTTETLFVKPFSREYYGSSVTIKVQVGTGYYPNPNTIYTKLCQVFADKRIEMVYEA